MSQRITQRTQAVAVKLGPDKLAIGKDQCGGTVPRLTMLRKRGQGSANVAREQRIVLKGWWHHGKHGRFGSESLEEFQLEGVVETRGIADIVFEQLQPRTRVELRVNFVALGAKPTAIGDDGIDFAIVRHIAKRLRKLPRRLCVRGIALMKDCEGSRKRGIAKVFVELRELPRCKKPLIDHRLRRKRTDIRARRQKGFSAFEIGR